MTVTNVRWATKAAQRGYTVAQNVVLFDERLPAPARLLYFQLAHYAWRNPDTFPTQEEIADNFGVTDRQLRRYAAALEERWLLERRERGLGRAVEYVLYEPAADYLEREPRPGRASKRQQPEDNPVENAGETMPSSDTDVRPSSDIHDRQARTPAAEPTEQEGSEDLPEQEPLRLVVGHAVTREEHQRVADDVDGSLRRAGGLT